MNNENRLRLLLTFLFTCLLSCTNSDNRKEDEGSPNETEQKSYYQRISDAPIDLYCYVDNTLDSETRLKICSRPGLYSTDNLSADILFTIRENRITDVETVFMFFDKNGNPNRDTTNYQQLNEILNNIAIEQVPIIKALGKGDFALRLQLERFCIGQVQFHELNTRAKDAVEKGSIEK